MKREDFELRMVGADSIEKLLQLKTEVEQDLLNIQNQLDMRTGTDGWRIKAATAARAAKFQGRAVDRALSILKQRKQASYEQRFMDATYRLVPSEILKLILKEAKQ